MSLGDRLRRAREAAGLTQAELGAQCGVSDATINRYEQGLRDPKPRMVAKLAQFLGVSADYLLGLTDPGQQSVAFGERLRGLRVGRGLSQADLGRQFNLAKQTISNYETGETYPTPPQLCGFAEYFGVTVDYLLGRGGAGDPAGEVVCFAVDDLDAEDRRDLAKYCEWLKDRREKKGRDSR